MSGWLLSRLRARRLLRGRTALIDPVFEALEAGRLHDIAIREALIDIARGMLIDKGEEGLGMRYGWRASPSGTWAIDLTAEKTGADSWRRRYATLERHADREVAMGRDAVTRCVTPRSRATST
jgi:hypothetical protein